jgi:class 3 adenylate cyclase
VSPSPSGEPPLPEGRGPADRHPRLAAILCGDTVGYSRHMSYDEEATHARVLHHRREVTEPSIAEHHCTSSNILETDFSLFLIAL